MKLTKNQENGKKLLQTIITKSWENNIFKKELIDNPISIIEKTSGEKFSLPEDIKLIVEDQTDSSIIYINIPAKPNYDNMELTDEQLEIISGGEVGLTVAGIIIFGIGVYLGYNQKK